MPDAWIEEVVRARQPDERQNLKHEFDAQCLSTPDDAALWHAKGILCMQLGEIADAESALEQACSLLPEQAYYGCSLARCFAGNQKFEEALEAYRTVIESGKKAEMVQALSGRFDCYRTMKKFKSALADAIELSKLTDDLPVWRFNQSWCYMQLAEYDQAYDILKELVTLPESEVRWRYQLAKCTSFLGRHKEAANQFAQLVALAGPDADLSMNLGHCCLKSGLFEQAKVAYEEVNALEPSALAFCHLGFLAKMTGGLDLAQSHYQRAVQLDPNDQNAWLNLGGIGFSNKASDLAREAFKEVLRIEPGSEVAGYYLAILEGEAPTRMPTEAVKQLFDGYADGYDTHMTGPLQYQLPGVFKTLTLAQLSKEVEKRTSHILDLGCGTGLIGKQFSDQDCALVGVDLSEAMLRIAKNRACYQTLQCQDIFEYLSENDTGLFDIVLAADVLNYMGDLQEFWPLLAHVLKPKGCFIASFETGRVEYEVSDTGRFCHNVEAQIRLAEAVGFSCVAKQNQVLRHNAGLPVDGVVVVFVQL